MSTEALTETIKTRVPPWIKRGFKRIARDRHLDPADIQRAAFREYLARFPAMTELEENGKSEKARAA